MKNFVISTLVASVIIQPAYSLEILDSLEYSHHPIQIVEHLLCPNGVFNVSAAHQFIFQLHHDVKVKYGVDLDLNFVVEEAMKILQQTKEFSESEISIAREFYSQFLKPEIRECRWGKSKKKKKQERRRAEFHKEELMLPDNMAWGYMLMLGGALMCLIPTGVTQGIGVGMVSGGLVVIGQAVVQGEKPYHVDPETGTPITSNNPPQGPSISQGVQF